MRNQVFVCLILFFISPVTFSDCVLKMRVADYKPYHYLNDQKEYVGLNIDMVKVLMEEANCTVTYHDVPWKRALSMMESGELDFMVNMSITEERSKYINFIGPQMDESVVLVVRNDFNHKLASLEDLKDLPHGIGIETGLFYGVEFDEKIKSDLKFRNKVETVHDINFNFRKLKFSRISGWITDKYYALHQIKTDTEYSDFKVYPNFYINRSKVYYGFSKESVGQELLFRLKAAYQRATKAGRFSKVLSQYE